MKRLEGKEARVEKYHDKKVHVELSVLELMMIKSMLGPLSDLDVSELVEGAYGTAAGKEVAEHGSLSYGLYKAAEDIIAEEGI